MYLGYANRGHQVYSTNVVSTKSQGQLIIMLFEGAVNFIELAEEGIKERNIEQAHLNIIKAQKIVTELLTTLNLESGDIAMQLATVYEYLYQRLVQANIKKDLTILEEVKSELMDLTETWKKIYKN